MGLARDETQAERVNASKTTSWHVLVFILNMIPVSHLCDCSRGPAFVPRLSPHTLWEGTVPLKSSGARHHWGQAKHRAPALTSCWPQHAKQPP